MCQGLNFRKKKTNQAPLNDNKKHHQTINLDFGNNHLEVEWASTRKVFVLHLFPRLAGSNAQGEERARVYFLLISNIFRKRSSWDFCFFFKIAFSSLGGEDQLKTLPRWMWAGGRNAFILFIYLFLPARPWGKIAKLRPRCRLRAGKKSVLPHKSFFPAPTRSTAKIRDWVSNLCFIPVCESEQSGVGTSYPACPDKSAVTSKETKYGKIPLSCLSRAPITHQHQ